MKLSPLGKAQRWLTAAITVILFFLPFFWLKPGEMDLGGDSNRLYFYDPLSFLANTSLYHLVPEGLGYPEPNFFYLIFVTTLALVKSIVRSPYVLISLVSGLKLSLAFLSVFLIVRNLLDRRQLMKNPSWGSWWASLLAGFFYILSPSSIGNWAKALMSHNQIFLNPLMFYLLLRYLLSFRWRYLWSALLVSFIFSPNFAITAAPAFFSFYPLALLFLFCYVGLVRREHLPWRGMVVGSVFFVGLQAFHLFPQILSLFEEGSFSQTRVFDPQSIYQEGVRYFTAILPLAKVSVNMLQPSPMGKLWWTTVPVALVVLLGFFRNKPKDKTMILTGWFFLVTLFLLSANITTVGVKLYQQLFYLPGFSMFRNFLGQWSLVFTFFYALLFGQALAVLFRQWHKARTSYKTYSYLSVLRVTGVGGPPRRGPLVGFLGGKRLAGPAPVGFNTTSRVAVVSGVLLLSLAVGAWPFLSGSLVNPVHWESVGMRVAIRMDPKYEETLSFVRSLPKEGKMLTLPLTDAYYQVVAGVNQGAYIGPSTIAYLTGKPDFDGYQILGPFAEEVMRFSREKNFVALTQVLSLLNIRYIFWNSDPNIYEEKFPRTPYTYMKTSLPGNQSEYARLVGSLPVKQIYTNGPYQIYEIDNRVYRPMISLAQRLKKEAQLYQDAPDASIVFVDEDTCRRDMLKSVCNQNSLSRGVSISYHRLSPVGYIISVKHQKSAEPFILVLNNVFSRAWQLVDEKKNPVAENYHFRVNRYANAWLISPGYPDGKMEYTMTLKLSSQRRFWSGLTITGLTLILLLAWMAHARLVRRRNHEAS